jgi:hypothetical protein
MKAHGSIRVVRRWCGMRTNPVRGYLDNLEGLNYGNLPSGPGSRARELANGLRPGTAVSSQNLSGVWVTVRS